MTDFPFSPPPVRWRGMRRTVEFLAVAAGVYVLSLWAVAAGVAR